MAKVALLSLPRPARREETRTFTDPAQPGVELTLQLQQLDPCGMAFAMDRAREMYLAHGENGFPLLNGTVAPLALEMCQNICMVEAMQISEPEERYTREELVGLIANMPAAGVQAFQWAGSLNIGPDGTLSGN